MKQRKGFLDGGSIPPISTTKHTGMTDKMATKWVGTSDPTIRQDGNKWVGTSDSTIISVCFVMGMTRFRQGKISAQTTSEATDLISAKQSNRKRRYLRSYGTGCLSPTVLPSGFLNGSGRPLQ